MKMEKMCLVLLLTIGLLATAIVPVAAANFNVYGHYEVKFEWTPKSRLGSSHDLRLMADVSGGPFSARIKLHHTPWWQLKDQENDPGSKLVLEEARIRWRDSLYNGAPRFDMFMGRSVWVGWDPVGFYAYEPGVGIEGLRFGDFRINALAAVKDDSNIDRFGRYVGGLQIKRSFGAIDWSLLFAGNARFDAALDTEADDRMYLVWPAEEYDHVTVLRMDGLVGKGNTAVSGFVGLHGLRDKYIAKQHTKAYQLDLVHRVNRDTIVEVGFRDYDPGFNPPYKKFEPEDFGGGGINDPLEMYAGEIGGYGLVNFKAEWPKGKRSDITLRLDKYLARPVPWWDEGWRGPGGEWIHPSAGDDEVSVTKVKVDVDVEGYALGAGHRIDYTPETETTRHRTDLSVAKDFRTGFGWLETRYELGLDSTKGSELAARHKVKAKLRPQAHRWTNLHPYAEVEYKTQGEEKESVLGLGAEYRTTDGLYVEVHQVLAESAARRNESFFKMGYRVEF